jgi:DNA-binding transcriptional LysR family regulator
MDLRQLRVFVEIVRRGSFTRAAEHLHIAQPAVSMTVRKLEDELDLTLLNRHEKRVTLTAEGESLLRHAERILDNLAVAEIEMAELRGLVRGEVRIGIPPMMSSYYFPQVIREFRDAYPSLKLAVNGEGAATIQRMLAKGDLDMGVIAGPKLREGLQSRHFLREEIVVGVPQDHALAARSSLGISDLLREPLILFKEGYYLRELMDELMEGQAQTPEIVFETNLFTLARSLIKHKFGIAIFLRMVVSDDRELAAISFDPPLYLDLQVAWKADRDLSRANRAFIDFLLKRSGQATRLTN